MLAKLFSDGTITMTSSAKLLVSFLRRSGCISRMRRPVRLGSVFLSSSMSQRVLDVTINAGMQAMMTYSRS